jgi:hypothetical protein
MSLHLIFGFFKLDARKKAAEGSGNSFLFIRHGLKSFAPHRLLEKSSSCARRGSA